MSSGNYMPVMNCTITVNSISMPFYDFSFDFKVDGIDVTNNKSLTWEEFIAGIKGAAISFNGPKDASISNAITGTTVPCEVDLDGAGSFPKLTGFIYVEQCSLSGNVRKEVAYKYTGKANGVWYSGTTSGAIGL